MDRGFERIRYTYHGHANKSNEGSFRLATLAFLYE